MYNYHGSARVNALWWRPENVYHGCGCQLSVAMEYYHVHIYDDVSRSDGPKEGGTLYCWPTRCGKKPMKAKRQARLELSRNPGYTSMDFCMCDTGCRVQVGRVDDK